jgi:hypothetical protein
MEIFANYLFSSSADNSISDHWIGFEAVEKAITTSSSSVFLINTLPLDQQDCLIRGTLTAEQEERAINDALTKYVPNAPPFQCIIYGANCCDLSPDKKRKQLLGLGFGLKEIKIYRGDLGDAKFPTTKRELNLLKYRATSSIS